MKILLTAGLALTFALVLGACEDADIAAPTSTPEVANLERTPPSATGIVSRGTWNQWWWIRHGASDATVVLGLEDLTAACDDDRELVFDGINFHAVSSPTGALRVLLKSTVNVQVYPAMALNCANLTTIPPVATGYAKFLYNDNQYMGDGPGARTYGVTVHGRVHDAEGQLYHLLARAQLFLPPWGDEHTPFEIRMLKIDMKPIH
jgi:hypothetical protein